MNKKGFLTCFFLLFCLVIKAQYEELPKHRIVTKVFSYGVGATHLYDSYLSPLEYSGLEVRLHQDLKRPLKSNNRFFKRNIFQAYINYTDNKASTNNTFAGLVSWDFGYSYKLPLNNHLDFSFGALSDLNLGFVYNIRNSNNPASARAYANIVGNVTLDWNFKLFKKNFTLSSQTYLPLIGARFSPHYGQSYYEIFTLNNNSGIVKFTSLVNQPAFRQQISLDVPIGQSIVRFSYYADIDQSKLNLIETHNYSHVFMVGFVKKIFKVPNK